MLIALGLVLCLALIVGLFRRVRELGGEVERLAGRFDTYELGVEYANVQLHNLNREQYDAGRRVRGG